MADWHERKVTRLPKRPRIEKYGTVTIPHDGDVRVEHFSFAGFHSGADAGRAALLWARKRIDETLATLV